MRYAIQWEGVTRFGGPVREHHVQLRLAPWSYEWQQVKRCTIETLPAVIAASHHDGFGNQVHRLAVIGQHPALTIKMRAEVETLLENPFEYNPIPPTREAAWIADSLRQAPRLWDFVLHRSHLTPLLPEVIGEQPVPPLKPGVPLLDQIQQAIAWIGDHWKVELTRVEPATSLRDVLTSGEAAAADLAHLMVALVRSWGVPARYVKGYIDPAYFDPDDEEPEAAPRPQTMHPWVEILLPGAGWRGFDPAQGLLADHTYIRVAVGRDAADVLTERASLKGDAEPSESATTVIVRREAG